MTCYCDSPVCETSWVCKTLGELRIAHRVLSQLRLDECLQVRTADEALSAIEAECEILVK